MEVMRSKENSEVQYNRKIEGLTLREKIGQTVMLRDKLANQTSLFGSLEAFFEKYPVGGFFVGAEIIQENAEAVRSVMNAIQRYQECSKIPLIFASDMENGCGSMIKGLTPFPYLMSLGAADSEALAYDYGRATALESLSIGIHWSFSPDSDLNLNPRNPLINVRSLGDNTEKVTRLLVSLIKGMEENGLGATAKVFPGDGVDDRDQHLITTVNPLSRKEWYDTYGVIFRELIANGLDSIMTGHISLPAFQRERVDGFCPPATLSYELTTNLLKKELGFQGVVVSDALIMGGFSGWYDSKQAEIECFKAGTDVLLWPSLDYFDNMEKAIESGEVSMERLNDAVSRVWEMKKRRKAFETKLTIGSKITEEDSKFVKQTAQRVADKSITLIRDRNGILPFKKGQINSAVIIGVTSHGPAYEEMITLKQELNSRVGKVDIRRNISFAEMEQISKDYDCIIFALHSRPHMPIGPISFSGAEAMSIWSSLSHGKEKTIVVSFGSPYYCNEYFERAPVYINAYSSFEVTHKSFAKALFGEIPFEGTSPVELKPVSQELNMQKK